MGRKRRNKKPSHPGTCVYCQVPTMVTEDHVIMQALLPDTWERDGVVVPSVDACRPCNNDRFGKHTSDFRAGVIANVNGVKTGTASEIYKRNDVRMIEYPGVGKRANAGVKRDFVKTDTGLWVPGTVHDPNPLNMKPGFLQLCMGLYYWKFKQYAPLDLSVEYMKLAVQPLQQPTKEEWFAVALYRQHANWNEKLEHNGETWAEWGLSAVEGFPAQGLWHFRFHGGAEFLVQASTPALEEVAGGFGQALKDSMHDDSPLAL